MIRLIIALLLSVLFLIFVLQNLKAVNLNFLLWRFEGSLALILILTFIIGIIVCLFASLPFKFKKILDERNKKKTEETNPKT
jgi:uncharacterized integral membrane protein